MVELWAPSYSPGAGLSALESFTTITLRMEAAGPCPMLEGIWYWPGAGAFSSVSYSSPLPLAFCIATLPPAPRPSVDSCAPSYWPGDGSAAFGSLTSMRLRMAAAGPCPIDDAMSYAPTGAASRLMANRSAPRDDAPAIDTAEVEDRLLAAALYSPTPG